MPFNNHNDIPTLTFFIVLLLGFAGSIVNFAKRQKRGMTIAHKLGLFLLDSITSGSLAVIGFYGALGIGFNELVAIASAGAIAHQGTRALYIVELIVAEKLGAKETFEEIKKGDK